MIRPSFCRSCGAPIWWCTTNNGRAMPVDREPVEHGNITIDLAGNAVVHSKATIGQSGLWTEPLYLSHHATCPQAPEWRNR